jgi:hypothetical protein
LKTWVNSGDISKALSVILPFLIKYGVQFLQYFESINATLLLLALSLTALGPISPISLKYQMLEKSFSEIKTILYLFLY